MPKQTNDRTVEAVREKERELHFKNCINFFNIAQWFNLDKTNYIRDG